MYVLNRYANYPNGNQGAWPLQLADLFLFHFSCNTSRSLVMKHNVLWRLYVVRSAAGNWMFLSAQTDLTLQQDDVTQQHIHSRGINLQHVLFANAWFFCVSQTCWYWCNWSQHHVNETPYPPGLCLTKTGHSLVTPYIQYRASKFLLCVIVCLYDTVQSSQEHTNVHTH